MGKHGPKPFRHGRAGVYADQTSLGIYNIGFQGADRTCFNTFVAVYP